jgi:hypothetical protein
MLETHGLMGKVPKHRENLKSLSFNNGIEYSIKALYLKFSFMRSWIYNKKDPNVLIIRFEDLTKKPLKEYEKIFNYCGFNIPEDLLQNVLDDYSKERMRKNCIINYNLSTFTDNHLDIFYNQTVNLVDLLGYDR